LVVCLLLSLSSTAHSDRLLTYADLSVLCSSDYIDYENVEPPIEGFDGQFLAKIFSLCDLFSVSTAFALPTRAELDGAVCDPLLYGEKSAALYGEAYDYDSQLPLQERTLCYFATRDADKDNVQDYLVDECGYFDDYDPDMDEDGVLNWFDAQHQVSDSSVQCGKPESLPALLDWSVPRIAGGQVKRHNHKDCAGADLSLCRYQQDLWKRYGVMIYERREKFPLEVAQALADVLDHVVKAPERVSGCEYSPVPRVVSVAKYPVREWSQNECLVNQSITAEAKATTRELVIYPPNLQPSSKLKILTVITHELAHFYQYDMDFDNPVNFQSLAVEGVWDTPEFNKLSEDRGWVFNSIPAEELKEKQKSEYSNMASSEDDFTVQDGTSYELNGIDLQTLQGYAELVMDWAGVLSSDYPTSDIYSVSYQNELIDAVDELWAASVVGLYGLQDPWEWHSDNFAAYLLLSLERHIEGRFVTNLDNPGQDSYTAISKKLTQQLHRVVLADWNGEFNYRYISDSMYEFFNEAGQFPIDKTSLDYLSCYYIINNKEEVFNAEKTYEAIHVEDTALDAQEIIKLKKLIDSYWADTCAVY